MRTFVRLTLAVLIAIATLVTAAGTATSASNLRIATGSATETLNFTMRDSVLGTITGSVILPVTFVADIICPHFGDYLWRIADLLIGRIVISRPAGFTGTLTPTRQHVRCINGLIELDIFGHPKLYKLGIIFSVLGTPLGTITYTGDAISGMGASPSSGFAGTSSSFVSNRGTTASLTLPWTFAVSPAVVWAAI